MESLLVKIFALALALSQVTTTPDGVKTQFDRTRDQDEVARLLSAGCTHMRKAFDIEDINLDELIATAMDDPQAMTSENKAFRGINFADLLTAYRQFCKNEKVPVPASADDRERVERTVLEVGAGILSQDFEPRPTFERCSWCDYRVICPASEA